MGTQRTSFDSKGIKSFQFPSVHVIYFHFLPPHARFSLELNHCSGRHTESVSRAEFTYCSKQVVPFCQFEQENEEL